MYVLGTAGHVDHGKSTLVKALTGIDPDRLEEERRREMTIDLGFAWLTLPSGREISLIDVPGHERFIKNMLAGVGGIDAALLVVAADDGPMPQTCEHLAVLDLLGISRGVVALTKTDAVEADWLALVEDEVRAALAGTSLAEAAIVPVSARAGAGLDALLAAIDALLDATPSRAGETDAPRMAIDRAFAIDGFGTVVTGTLAGGPLRIGDEIELQPRGLRGRVRGLQTHRRRETVALPGARVAVNIGGVAHGDVARGDVLAPPGLLRPTALADVWLRLTADAPPLEQNDRLDLFVGAAEAACRVTLLDCERIAPGQGGWAQLRLERPMALSRGDRYIVRRASPSATVGGGRVVEPHPARHRRFRPEVIATLEALARGTPGDLLLAALADGGPQTNDELARRTGLSAALVADGAAQLAARGAAVALGSAAQPALIGSGALETLRAAMLRALAGYHRRYPLRQGIGREELRSRLKLGADGQGALLAYLAEAGAIELGERAVWLAGHRATPDAAQRAAAARFLAELGRAPYNPPPPDLDAELIGYLTERSEAVRVSDDILFAPEAYRSMIGWVDETLAAQGSLTVAQFRDRFGSSRRYALALLEHLDAQRVTRRDGDLRVSYAGNKRRADDV